MPKIADLWKLANLGQLEPGTPLARLYPSLKNLERILRLIHLAVENPILHLDVTPVPTDSPLDLARYYAADSAPGDTNAYSRNEAGEVERQTGRLARVTTQFDVASSTTLANVPGLARNLADGEVATFTANLFTASDVAGGVKVAMGGTVTPASIIYDGWLVDSSAIAGQARATALSGVVAAATGVVEAHVVVVGTVVVTTGGTLTVMFAQEAADVAASSVLVGSTLRLG